MKACFKESPPARRPQHALGQSITFPNTSVVRMVSVSDNRVWLQGSDPGTLKKTAGVYLSESIYLLPVILDQ